MALGSARVQTRAVAELAQEWMHRLAGERTNLRLKQREHEEPIHRKLDHLGLGILGGRLYDHAVLGQAPELRGSVANRASALGCRMIEKQACRASRPESRRAD